MRSRCSMKRPAACPIKHIHKIKGRGKTETLRFFGSSSSSPKLPVTLVRGTLSQDSEIFKTLRSSCKEELSRDAPPIDRFGGNGWGRSFRVNEAVAAKRANGICCKALAPEGVQNFVAYIRRRNPRLYKTLDKSRHISYQHGKTQVGKPKQLMALEARVKDALFAYATINQWTDGVAEDPWHVDGGPSLVFLAVTISGQRIVEVEDADGMRYKHHMRPGDWYISSPSCFWHRILPVRGSTEPAETLLLRSAILSKRLSGGRDRGDGTRTPGFIYGTRNCFETFAATVADHLAKTSFSI